VTLKNLSKPLSCYLSLILIACFCSSLNATQDTDLFDLTFEELLQVNISVATKTEQTEAQAPAIVTLITEQEIVSSGARNLFELMRFVPGVTPIKQIAAEDALVVRGLSLKDGVLVLIDGVPANDAFAGAFEFYQRPLDDVAKIEVIRGPGSALYGEYAVSAVISIVTKSAERDDKRYRMSVLAGSHDEVGLSFDGKRDFSKILSDLLVAVSFSYRDSDGDELYLVQDHLYNPVPGRFLEPLSNPTLTPTKRQQSTEIYNGHVKLDWRDWTLSYNHSQVISTPLFSHLGLVTEEGKTLKDVNSDRLLIKFDGQLSESHSWLTQLYWAEHENKLFGQSQPPHYSGDEDQDGLNEEWPSGLIESFYHKTRDIGLESEWGWQINSKHFFLLQAAAKDVEVVELYKMSNASLHSRGPASIFPVQDMTHQYMPEDVSRDVYSLSFQELFDLSSNTTITIGARYDDYSDFGDTLNPRLALVHQFNKRLYGKFLYGEAFKPPSFVQLFELTPTQTVNRSRGNINLNPTEIDSTELQLGYQWPNELELKINLFNNETSGEIYYNATPGIQQWQNSGKRQSRGGEIDLHGSGGFFDYFSINYSYQSSSGVDRGVGADIHPKHRFNAQTRSKFSDTMGISFGLNYFSSPSREPIDTRSRIEAMWLANVALYANDIFAGYDLLVAVDNLFDDDGRYPVDAGLLILDDIPIEGRSFRITLGKRF